MRKKDIKTRTEKRTLKKCKGVCKTYDPVQYAYADVLEQNDEIAEIRCNVVLDGEESEYMTDFVCVKTNGDLMVRECIKRSMLIRPSCVKLLDISRNYWLRHGIKDWGIVVDEEV